MDENTNLDEYYDFDNIMERIMSRVRDDFDKREGAIIWDATSPVAAELAQMYIVLKNNIDLVFPDTAVGEYLDRLVEQMGISRKQATNAIRKGQFYDESDELMDVEIGQRFTLGDLTYRVIEKISKGIYQLECETSGIIGNTSSGTIVPIDYIQGLGRAVITDILIPGEDEETDESLRERYYESTEEKAFGGNVADYKNKTKEIAGVGAVKVTPVWNGGGTVKLTILDSNFDKATGTLIETVQEEICPNMEDKGMGLAPIGHIVTVDTAENFNISVSSKLTMDEGYTSASVKEQAKQLIEQYFLSLRKTWEDSSQIIVRISQIDNLLLSLPNVLDVENTMLNNKENNITLTAFQIPIVDEVVIS